MGRKKQEPTFIKSIRVNEDIKDFLESLENANLFVLQLLEDTNEFKKSFVSWSTWNDCKMFKFK